MNLTVDELKILLALYGNVRIPHLEEEIFANNQLALTYIDILLGDSMDDRFKWVLRGEKKVVWYVQCILKSRWPAAEQYIAQYTLMNEQYHYTIKHNHWV